MAKNAARNATAPFAFTGLAATVHNPLTSNIDPITEGALARATSMANDHHIQMRSTKPCTSLRGYTPGLVQMRGLYGKPSTRAVGNRIEAIRK